MFDRLNDILSEHIDYLVDASDSITGFFHAVTNIVKDKVHR
jgi:tRNA A37 threonylcarbamoyladenosine dehydratase